MSDPAASHLADLGVHGRTAGPALPLAAGRSHRAPFSGDASRARHGQVAVAVHEVRDEFRSQRDGACRSRSREVDLVGRPLPATSGHSSAPARPQTPGSPGRPPRRLARTMAPTGGGGYRTRSDVVPGVTSPALSPIADRAGTCNDVSLDRASGEHRGSAKRRNPLPRRGWRRWSVGFPS